MIGTPTLNEVTCTIKIEVSANVLPSAFRTYLKVRKPHFIQFTNAFKLQIPEFYYRIGGVDVDEVDHLPDEVGKMQFSLLVESQAVLSPERAKHLAQAANAFTSYWEVGEIARHQSLTVMMDGNPVELD
ncbi:hypothetical protein [Spirosoma areae]